MPGKYETPRGKAATDAKRRYYEKPMIDFIRRSKREKELYIAAAKAAGKSLNEWIETTLDAAAGIEGKDHE